MSAEYVEVIRSVRNAGSSGYPPIRGRWQAHWIDGGPEEKLVFYCTECAERQFYDGD